jgi:hypothetical protein
MKVELAVCRSAILIRNRFARTRLAILLPLSLLAALLPFQLFAPAQAAINSDNEIIYIDSNGFIRVLDTNRVGNQPFVEWVSSTGGWTDFAVGDVNNDGDAEIIAIGGDANSGKLAVYDPVVTSGTIDTAKVINNIPWATLYETTLPGKPTLVAAGNLNPNRPGDEIAYGYELKDADKVHPNDKYRVALIEAANPPPDGRAWTPLMTPHDFDHIWTQMVIGELDDRLGAELVLLDSHPATSELSVYRIEQQLTRLYDNQSNNKTWYSAAIGKFQPGDANDLAAVRDAPLDLPSLVVMRYDGSASNNFKDIYGEYFGPPPLFVFFANSYGRDHSHLFMMRSLPTTLTTQPHFFNRKFGKDSTIPVNLRLDVDNGYQVGAGGDLDGDGLDDVVVMRNNRLRIYPNIATALNFNEYGVTTNAHSLKIADLDNKGFVPIPLLAATPNPLAATLDAGLHGQPVTITLTNVGTADSTPFAAAIEGNPTWVTISPAISQTPATLALTFDARSLVAGQYTAKLLITPINSSLRFTPLSIPLALTVKSGVAAQPAATVLTVYPCTPPFNSFMRQIYVAGTTQLFTAQVIPLNNASQAPWATVTTLANRLPTTVTVTVDPSKLSGNFEQANLHIESTIESQVPVKRDFPFDVLCASAQLYLPLVGR